MTERQEHLKNHNSNLDRYAQAFSCSERILEDRKNDFLSILKIPTLHLKQRLHGLSAGFYYQRARGLADVEERRTLGNKIHAAGPGLSRRRSFKLGLWAAKLFDTIPRKTS